MVMLTCLNAVLSGSRRSATTQMLTAWPPQFWEDFPQGSQEVCLPDVYPFTDGHLPSLFSVLYFSFRQENLLKATILANLAIFHIVQPFFWQKKNMELHCKVILLFLSGPVFSFNDFLRKVKARRPMFRNPNIKVWVTAEAKASRCCSTSTNGFSMVSSATFYHSSSLTMRHDAHSLLMCWYSSNPKYTTVLGSFANEDQCRKSQFCHWQWLLMEALF